MADIREAWQAGVDAVVADNTINRGGFVDALQTVITTQFSNQEGNDLVDAVATEFNRLNIINNPTYNNLRSNIIDDPVAHVELFEALGTIGRLDELLPAVQALRLIELREDRDNINDALDRYDVLIAAEPNGVVGRLVKETMRAGKDLLRQHRETVRNEIRTLTGDPDG